MTVTDWFRADGNWLCKVQEKGGGLAQSLGVNGNALAVRGCAVVPQTTLQ